MENRKPSYYVKGAPGWWDPDQVPQHLKKEIQQLLKTEIGIEAQRSRPTNGLVIFGPAGVGKSSAALGIAYYWGQAGEFSQYQDFDELMLRVRATWRGYKAQETTEDIVSEMARPAFLVLDDVGKRAAPEVAEFTSAVINRRINHPKGKRPTLLTCNNRLDTEQGRKEFSESCDGRILERYTNLDVNAARWGINLRLNQ